MTRVHNREFNSTQGVAVGIATGVAAVVAARWLARRRHAVSFSGRNVLITGGSRGLGLVLARQLASEGARPWTSCSRRGQASTC